MVMHASSKMIVEAHAGYCVVLIMHCMHCRQLCMLIHLTALRFAGAISVRPPSLSADQARAAGPYHAAGGHAVRAIGIPSGFHDHDHSKPKS